MSALRFLAHQINRLASTAEVNLARFGRTFPLQTEALALDVIEPLPESHLRNVARAVKKAEAASRHEATRLEHAAMKPKYKKVSNSALRQKLKMQLQALVNN